MLAIYLKMLKDDGNMQIKVNMTKLGSCTSGGIDNSKRKKLFIYHDISPIMTLSTMEIFFVFNSSLKYIVFDKTIDSIMQVISENNFLVGYEYTVNERRINRK